MKFNKWTLALAGVGLVSLGSVAQAEEQHSVMTSLASTTLSGYVDTSAIWKLGTGNGGAAGTPGRTFDNDDKADGFNLHAVKLTLEKPLDEGNWSAGYKTDLIFGPDASYYGSLINGGAAAGADEFSVKQAYVALRAPVGNGLDLKMGVFDTIIGYEVFETGNNPNFSRSYGYFLEPTQHTGLLASYKVNDMVSLSAGIANTYTGAVNGRQFSASGSAETRKAYMASVTVTMPESAGALQGSSLYLGYVGGKNGAAAAANTKDTHNLYLGYTLNTPVEGLSVGMAYDYREDASGVGLVDNDAWAGALYASFQASEKLKLNGRLDYTQGSTGTYYASPGDRNELGSATLTADYSLWENVITRLEARWDRALGGDAPFAGSTVGGKGRENALTVAANVIYKF